MQPFSGFLNTFAKDSSVLNRKIKDGTIRRTISFAKPHALRLTGYMFIVFVNAVIWIINPLIYRAIINNGILKNDVRVIINLALFLALLGLLNAVGRLAQLYLATQISEAVVVQLRTKLFEHLQKMSLSFFSRIQTGALINRIMSDAAGARTAFTDILSNVFGNAISVILIFGAMFVLSWHIALAILVLLPMFVLPARYWGRRVQVATRESYNKAAVISSLMFEQFNVAGALLSKLFGTPEKDAALFKRKASILADANIKRSVYAGMFATLLVLMSAFATALAYGWGGVLATEKILDLGTVVAFVTLLGRLYSPMMGLSNTQVSVMTALVSFERVFEVLDLVPTIVEKPGAVKLSDEKLKISFDQVSFRYPTGAEVSLASLESISIQEESISQTILHEINFSIEPRQLVAIVGPSGAGKTTVTRLISRLYDVQSGVVRINGVDVRDIQLESLRERIGVVTQDAHLFNDTVRANLMYAHRDAKESEIRSALKGAQLLDLVEKLRDGLDTYVGGQGYRFSGGEKQRLAIARVLLKSPDLVILDEATAQLDSKSEEAVHQAFERVMMGRTAIVIAHRLSTIVKADLILVMDKGRIVQRGTHRELVAMDGVYSELYQKQYLAHIKPN